MIVLLGPPPKGMLQNSNYATEFFDSQGIFINTFQWFLTLIKENQVIGKGLFKFPQCLWRN